MTEKARRPDGEEQREERLPAEWPHELTPERDLTSSVRNATDATDGAESAEENDTVDAPTAEQANGASERARTRRASRKTVVAPTSATETPAAEADETADVAALSAFEADRIELEAQGFSPEEAERLIEVSKRLESSAEALASQAEMKRLRFAQWLVERGRLDEFSV